MEDCYKLEHELQIQLQIGRFLDKITRSLYSNSSYPSNLTSGLEQQSILNLLRREYQDLEILLGRDVSGKLLHLVVYICLHLDSHKSPPSSCSKPSSSQFCLLYTTR